MKVINTCSYRNSITLLITGNYENKAASAVDYSDINELVDDETEKVREVMSSFTVPMSRKFVKFYYPFIEVCEVLLPYHRSFCEVLSPFH